MSMDFTKNQQQAIDAREGNYVVSASAGSGKTAVLTERAFRLIKEGTKLSELLILTFTNLAAAQMRDKIRNKLNKLDDQKYKDIASCIDAANIQTYDAYALNLVKKYHSELGLPKNVGVIENALFTIEKNKILTKILEEYIKENDTRVIKLINDYCYKNIDTIFNFILSLSDKFDLIKDKEKFINSFVDDYYCESFIDEMISIYISEFKKTISFYYEKVKCFENVDYINRNIDELEKLINVKSYDELFQLIVAQNVRLSCKGKDASLADYPDDKSTHENINSYLNKISKALIFEKEEDIRTQYLGTKDNVITIIEIIKKLDNELNKFKDKFGVYKFTDIFKFAMKLTEIPDICREIKTKFKYIMIDEYQDTSDLQEEFINAISNNNVYVVGDVKQSIYRFRNANCKIFLNKFNNYQKGNGGNLIILPENFRSRVEVVDTVNSIFERLMDLSSSDLDYKNGHIMKFGNKNFKNDSSFKTDFMSYSVDDVVNSEFSTQEFEARAIATDIQKKVISHFQVYDEDTGGLRNCTYKDFAVLMSVKSKFNLYKKIFNEYKIPLFANYERTIRDNDLTLAFENIVKLIAMNMPNAIKVGYKHSFMSVLRSFIIGENDDEIEKVIIEDKIQQHHLTHLINKTVEDIKGKNLKEQLCIIVKNFDVYNRLITVGDVSDGISILEYYFNIASQMDQMGYTIDDFVMYFDDLKKFEIEPSFVPNDDVDNSVKLLTIHASKGLQFKIVYFPDINHKFNTESIEGNFLYSKKYGISIPNVYSKEVFSFTKNLIVNEENIENIKEEIRLFYVALTRSEEKIIFVGNRQKVKKERSYIFDCKSFCDFLNYFDIQFNEYACDLTFLQNTMKESKDEGKVNLKKTPLMNGEKIKITHASKDLDEDTDSNLLLLGNKYHYYLELVDFNKKDASFIKNKKDKDLISNFLSNDLFKNCQNAKVLHEFPFYDEKNEVSGVIDLLIIYNDHIDIVDFKLSNVSDEKYEEQVGKYKQYISQISNLPISTYVTGILSGNVKKVN